MPRFPLIVATAIAVASTAVIATAQDTTPDRPDRPDRAERFLERFDTDGDGTVTRAEIEAAEAARFAAADTDGDGQLSAAEIAAAHEARREERRAARIAALIERFDENGDGVLSAEEAAAMRGPGPDRMFDLIDADDDGTITQAELDEMGHFRRGGWGKRHGHGHGHGHGHHRGPWGERGH